MKMPIFSFFQKTEIRKNFLILTAGTGFSQALPIILSPVITRLYTPQDFGYLSFYLSIISITSVIASARYELAIILPKDRSYAISILKVCFSISIFISAVLLILLIFLEDKVYKFFNIEKQTLFLYLIPLSFLLTAFYQSLNYFLIREKEFAHVSKTKVGQSTSLVLSRISFGVLKLSFWGLIISEIIGNLVAFAIQMKKFRSILKSNHLSLTPAIFANILKRYKEFPLYNLVPSFLDSLTLSLPIFFITKFYSTETAGHLGLCTRILTIPATVLSTSLAQILLQKITEMRRKKEKVLVFVFNIIKKGCLFSFFPALILFFFSQKLFVFAFGNRWLEAGLFAEYLSIPFALRLIVSPLSIIFISFEKVRIGAIWQISYFVISFIVFIFASQYDSNVFIITYALNEFIMYSLYLALIIYTISKTECKGCAV